MSRSRRRHWHRFTASVHLRSRLLRQRRRVVDGDASVGLAGKESVAIRAKSNARAISLQCKKLLAAFRIPDLHRFVLSRAYEASAVGAKGHALRSGGVSLERSEFL